MPASSFVKGEFLPYRAITKIHLGAIEDNLLEGEVVLYDGHTMKRGDETHPMNSLRAAIKVGWLTPEEAPEQTYTPQPAGVKVHRADGLSREEVNLSMVHDEEVNVGSIHEVRPDNAPATHVAKRAGEERATTKGAKAENPDEGRVVSRLKTSAKQGPVEIGKDDRRVVKTLDNKTAIEVEKVAVATGDVQEAIEGEDLADILPDAANVGIPDPGVAGEGRGDESTVRAGAVFGKGSSTIGGAEDGEVIAKIVTVDDRLRLIREFIPGFAWDTDVQWAKRAKVAAARYGHIPAVINYILDIETAAVKKEIRRRMTME